MSRHKPFFGNHLKRLAILSLATAAPSLLIPFKTRAQENKPWVATTWTITIDVTDDSPGHKREDPQYTYTRSVGSCADSPQYPAPLSICLGDTVHWKVITNKKKDSLRIFQGDGIFDDANQNPTHRFDAKNGTSTDGGMTDPSNAKPGTYDYCVAVFDKNRPYLYIHDPKVIIGTGLLVAVKEELGMIDKNAKELAREFQDVTKSAQLFKSRDAAKDAEEDAQKIQKLVEEIREKLAVR